MSTPFEPAASAAGQRAFCVYGRAGRAGGRDRGVHGSGALQDHGRAHCVHAAPRRRQQASVRFAESGRACEGRSLLPWPRTAAAYCPPSPRRRRPLRGAEPGAWRRHRAGGGLRRARKRGIDARAYRERGGRPVSSGQPIRLRCCATRIARPLSWWHRAERSRSSMPVGAAWTTASPSRRWSSSWNRTVPIRRCGRQRLPRPVHPCGMLRDGPRCLQPLHWAVRSRCRLRRNAHRHGVPAWTSALVAAGVEARRIADVNCCTVCDNRNWFSYRAQGGVCGRHGAFAVRTAAASA